VVLVLGDPAYYRHFGIEPGRAITPPYPLPDARNGAWRSLRLSSGVAERAETLDALDPWRLPELWTS